MIYKTWRKPMRTDKESNQQILFNSHPCYLKVYRNWKTAALLKTNYSKPFCNPPTAPHFYAIWHFISAIFFVILNKILNLIVKHRVSHMNWYEYCTNFCILHSWRWARDFLFLHKTDENVEVKSWENKWMRVMVWVFMCFLFGGLHWFAGLSNVISAIQ